MEMECFRLKQSKNIFNPICIKNLDKDKYLYKMDTKTFEQLDDLIVDYYDPKVGLEICDILKTPCFMIADRLKEIFMLLEPEIQFKGIQLFPSNYKKDQEIKDPMPLYWIPSVEPTQCLHTSTKFYDTGLVEELVLKESLIQEKNIIKVAGLVEEIWVVSLTAAESILRRRPLSIGLERVKVRR